MTIVPYESLGADCCGCMLRRKYKLDAPKGVNGRNSDNAKIGRYLKWQPSIRLRDGMAKAYEWVESQIAVPAAHA